MLSSPAAARRYRGVGEGGSARSRRTHARACRLARRVRDDDVDARRRLEHEVSRPSSTRAAARKRHEPAHVRVDLRLHERRVVEAHGGSSASSARARSGSACAARDEAEAREVVLRAEPSARSASVAPSTAAGNPYAEMLIAYSGGAASAPRPAVDAHDATKRVRPATIVAAAASASPSARPSRTPTCSPSHPAARRSAGAPRARGGACRWRARGRPVAAVPTSTPSSPSSARSASSSACPTRCATR